MDNLEYLVKFILEEDLRHYRLMRDTVKSVVLEEFLCKLLWSSLQEMENILTLPQGSAVKQNDKAGRFWSPNACLVHSLFLLPTAVTQGKLLWEVNEFPTQTTSIDWSTGRLVTTRSAAQNLGYYLLQSYQKIWEESHYPVRRQLSEI